MVDKQVVIVDPNFRRMAEIFSREDLARLHEKVEVIWGKDEPMPDAEFARALPGATAVVCADWRYGNAVLKDAPNLRAILDVSGAFPSFLDYDYCFASRIRVLSAAPAFGRQVAEMALGMALAACRDICAGDYAFRTGQEKWLWDSNVGTFMLYGKPVGFIGFGSLRDQKRYRWHTDPECCPSRGVRAVAQFPQHVYAIDHDGFRANLYESSTARLPLGDGRCVEVT